MDKSQISNYSAENYQENDPLSSQCKMNNLINIKNTSAFVDAKPEFLQAACEHKKVGISVQGLIGSLPMTSSCDDEKSTGVLRCDVVKGAQDVMVIDFEHSSNLFTTKYKSDPGLVAGQPLISIADPNNDIDNNCPRYTQIVWRKDNHADSISTGCINYSEVQTQQPLAVCEDINNNNDEDNCHKAASYQYQQRMYDETVDVESSTICPILEDMVPEKRQKHEGGEIVQGQFQRAIEMDHIIPCMDKTQYNRLAIDFGEIISGKITVGCQTDNRDCLGLLAEDKTPYSKVLIEGYRLNGNKDEERTNYPIHIQSCDEPHMPVKPLFSVKEQQFQIQLKHAEKMGNTFLRVKIPTENRQAESRPYSKHEYVTSHNVLSKERTKYLLQAQLKNETSVEKSHELSCHDSSVTSEIEKYTPTQINTTITEDKRHVQQSLETEETFRRPQPETMDQRSIILRQEYIGEDFDSQHGLAHTYTRLGTNADNILTQDRLHTNQTSSSHDDQLQTRFKNMQHYQIRSNSRTDHAPSTRLSHNKCYTANCNSLKRISYENSQPHCGYHTGHTIYEKQLPVEHSKGSRTGDPGINIFSTTTRVSPSPLFVRSEIDDSLKSMKSRLNAENAVNCLPNQFEDEVKGSQFTLQDPPVKFKRQLSNDTAVQGSGKPIVFANPSNIDQMIPSVDSGTPKRLKPSSFDTRSTDSQIESHNHHIRTSSVIRTPKAKEQNVFVFPETTPTSKQLEYRFDLSDSHDVKDIHTVSTLGKEQVCPEINIKGQTQIPSSENSYPPRDHPKPMYREMYYIPSDCLGKPSLPLRSQSNIEDHSPTKLNRQELEKIRYDRSFSLPVNKKDRGFRSVPLFRRQDAYYEKETQQTSQPSARCNLDFDNYTLPNIHETDDRLALNHTLADSRSYNYKLTGDYGFHNMPQQWDPPNWSASSAYCNRFAPPRLHSHTSICCNAFPANSNDPNIRRSGDINVRIQCSGVPGECQDISRRLRLLNNPSHHGVYCDCKRIEEQVLQLAMDAYSKIPRTCYSQEEQNHMEHELNLTNSMVLEAIKVATRMKELCDHGRTITNVYNGSVVIRLNCPTLASLEDLWMKFKSVSCLLKPPSTPSKKPTSHTKRSTVKRVVKSAENLRSIPESPKPLIIKTRSSSTPTLLNHSPLNSPRSPSKWERNLSLSSFGDQSPRRVFQELTEQNSPRSPSRGFNLEDIRQVMESTQFHLDKSDDDQENVFTQFIPDNPNLRSHSPYVSSTQILSTLSLKQYSPR